MSIAASAALALGAPPATERHKHASRTRQVAGLVGGPLVFAVLWFAPTHDSATAQHAIAVAALMITLFVTEAVDHATAGLIGLMLFWATGGRIHHVALYIGGGRMIEAPYSGSRVRIAPVRYGGIVGYATRLL